MKTKNEVTKETKETLVDGQAVGDPAAGDTVNPAFLEKEMAPTRHSITGTDAEDIRSLNRALTQIRMEISAQVIMQDVFEKQSQETNKKYKEASDKQGALVVDFTKKSAELQKVVDKAFNELGLNPADKWQFDPDACKFFRN